MKLAPIAAYTKAASPAADPPRAPAPAPTRGFGPAVTVGISYAAREKASSTRIVDDTGLKTAPSAAKAAEVGIVIEFGGG